MPTQKHRLDDIGYIYVILKPIADDTYIYPYIYVHM